MLCGLANIAGMNHDKAPSLRPWPIHSKAVAGRVVASTEGSPERSVRSGFHNPTLESCRGSWSWGAVRNELYLLLRVFAQTIQNPVYKFHGIDLPHRC